MNKLMETWIDKKYSPERAREEMLREGYGEEDIQVMLKDYKKMQTEKRQKTGFVCMAAGALLGFVSCVLTMLHLIPALTGLLLYGLTTLAIVVVLIGCYLVFE